MTYIIFSLVFLCFFLYSSILLLNLQKKSLYLRRKTAFTVSEDTESDSVLDTVSDSVLDPVSESVSSEKILFANL